MIIKKERTSIPSFARRGRISKKSKDLIHEARDKKVIVSANDANQIIQSNQYSKVKLEIGFGDGKHLLKRALLEPDVLFIGCEVYLSGIAQLLNHAKQHDVQNILIYNDDARDFCLSIPDFTFSMIYVLFPDPWPKTKHHKRRIINHEFIQLLHQKKSNDGNILIATDHKDYATWIEHVLKSESMQYSNKIPDDWIGTKYQKKSERLRIESHYFTL